LFGNGFNCAQSVFAAFSPESGIPEEESLRIATPFGGGLGRQQLVCGAVTGALMALGAEKGKGTHDPETKKQEVYLLTRKFCEEFVKRHRSLNCRDLLDGLSMLDQKPVAGGMWKKPRRFWRNSSAGRKPPDKALSDTRLFQIGIPVQSRTVY